MSMTQRVADVLKPHVSQKSRSRIVRARFRARTPTARARVLPDFLVIGAMRSGTSSLFKYLTQHPEIAPSLRKEVEYFTRHHDRGELWYRQHFALSRHQRAATLRQRRVLAFEATPYYLYAPRCPERAYRLLPKAKLIALLRDPVERAFSDYEHMVRLGFETLSFADAVQAEPARLAPELARMAEDPMYFSPTHHHFSYVSRGRYAEQIRRWVQHYPRGSILLIESKHLYQDPAETFLRILDFLDVSLWAPPSFRNYSYVGRPPDRSRIDPGVRHELMDTYAADDRALHSLLGVMPSWRQT